MRPRRRNLKRLQVMVRLPAAKAVQQLVVMRLLRAMDHTVADPHVVASRPLTQSWALHRWPAAF
jgi:hypothetical protein